MKILILSHAFFPHIGGIETNSEVFCTSFSEMSHEVHLVTWTPDNEINKFPFKVIRNPGIKKLIHEHIWADVILENNPCLRLSWPNLFLKKPIVVVLNTWISKENGKRGLQEHLKLWWLKKAQRVIAVSRVIRDTCFKNADVVSNPYRAQTFRNFQSPVRSKDFVFLGRLVSDKGADLAMKALQLLNSLNEPDSFAAGYSLTIIGDGPESSRLRSLARALGMLPNVTFKGALSGAELTNCLNEHKYLLVPSKWKEPFGNVALEGLACGCIPIVADGGGLVDAIGSTGLVFERGNAYSLFSAMKALISNSVLEQDLISKSEAHLKNHHPDVVAKRYLEIIEEAYCTRKNKTRTSKPTEVLSPTI
jgi:glycosyltransferase involved in cell wall biosynthesis